jgi:ribosomal protein L12E/L44/L45/RPP1/RPP2
MLKIDGAKLMTLLAEPPSPRIGLILHALFQDVLDDPTRNTEEYLGTRAKALAALPPEELKKLGEAGKEKKEKEEEREVEEIRKRYGVK